MRLKRNPLILLFILPFFVSCVSNADFDQIAFNPTPALTGPLVFSELNQLDFFDDVTNTEITIVSDATDVDFFETSFVRNNLVRFEIDYDIVKTFDRRFTFTIEHLNSSGNVIFSHNPIIMEFNIDRVQSTLVVDLSSNPEIFNTTRMRVIVVLSPAASTIDPNVENSISFKTTGSFFLSL